jgi:hypothetical protein
MRPVAENARHTVTVIVMGTAMRRTAGNKRPLLKRLLFWYRYNIYCVESRPRHARPPPDIHTKVFDQKNGDHNPNIIRELYYYTLLYWVYGVAAGFIVGG